MGDDKLVLPGKSLFAWKEQKIWKIKVKKYKWFGFPPFRIVQANAPWNIHCWWNIIRANNQVDKENEQIA